MHDRELEPPPARVSIRGWGTAMARSTAKLHLLLAALGAASGCAYGSQAGHLAWPPPGEALAPAPPPAAPAVALERLDDQRAEPRQVVGEVRNWLYLMADLETTDDVAAWATAALRDELQRAGVRVVGAAAGVPVLGGELRGVHASGYFRYSGEVELRAWLRSGDAVTYHAHVRGAGTAGSIGWSTVEGYEDALASALRDASRQVASEVAAAAAQWPPGAAPSLEPAVAAPPSPPAPEAPALRARADWYLGAQLGFRSVRVQSAGGSISYSQEGDQTLPTSIAVQLGFLEGRRLLLGGEASLTVAWHYTPAGTQGAGLTDEDVYLTQLLATATFYPLERSALAPGEREVAPSGWYLRGGGGLAFFHNVPDSATAPPGSPTWDVSGPAVTLGSGWAFPVGRTRTRTVNVAVDLGWQFYGSSASEPERSFSLGFAVGLVLY
jgi:hypothetical protein